MTAASPDPTPVAGASAPLARRLLRGLGEYAVFVAVAAAATWLIARGDPAWSHGYALARAGEPLGEWLKHDVFWGIEYGFIGHHLALGHGFAGPYPELTTPTAVMPPILPLVYGAVFALFGHHTSSGLTALLALRALTVASGLWCVYHTCRAASAGRTTTTGAFALATFALIGAFAPRHLLFLAYDEWFMFATVGVALWGAWHFTRRLAELRARHVAAWGALLGAFMLLQPVAGAALTAATLLLSLHTRRKRLMLLVFPVMLLVMSPWMIRNQLVFGRFMPVKSTLWFELYFGNVVLADGVQREEELVTAGVHPYFPGDERKRGIELGEQAYIEAKKQLFLQDLRENPLNYFSKVARRVLYVTVLFPFSQAHQTFYNPVVPKAAKYALYPLPFIACIVLLMRPTRRDPFVQFLVAFWACFLGPYVLINFWLRYWIHILPLHILLVFVALPGHAPPPPAALRAPPRP